MSDLQKNFNSTYPPAPQFFLVHNIKIALLRIKNNAVLSVKYHRGQLLIGLIFRSPIEHNLNNISLEDFVKFCLFYDQGLFPVLNEVNPLTMSYLT